MGDGLKSGWSFVRTISFSASSISLVMCRT